MIFKKKLTIVSGSLDSLTKLVLVNALYFKGDWLHKFNPLHTSQQPFYLGSETNKVIVPMMFINENFLMGYIDELDSNVLELPYKVNYFLNHEIEVLKQIILLVGF